MARRNRFAAGFGYFVVASVAVLATLVAGTALAWPPQANVGTGFHNLGDSYFSQTGVNFGFSIPTSMPNGGSGVVGLNQAGALAPNINFQNGGQPAIPFGLGPATPGASFGYAVKTPMGTMYFGLTSSLGSDRSIGSTSGSITMMQGGTGFISDTSQSPFVTSVVPVVGDNNAQTAPAGANDPHAKAADAFDRKLKAAQNDPVGQPVASLAEIRAQQAAEDQAINAEYSQKMQTAAAALADGKPGVARLYYQQVARHANGSLRQQAIDALRSLTPTSVSEHP